MFALFKNSEQEFHVPKHTSRGKGIKRATTDIESDNGKVVGRGNFPYFSFLFHSSNMQTHDSLVMKLLIFNSTSNFVAKEKGKLLNFFLGNKVKCFQGKFFELSLKLERKTSKQFSTSQIQ